MGTRRWPGPGESRSDDIALDAPAPDRDTDLARRNGAATEHLAAGRPEEAVATLEPLLEDCRRLLGAEHPDTLVVEGNLAVAYVVTGDDGSGAPLMLANLAGRERVLGPEHVTTLTARDATAAMHRLAGRHSEALWLYSQVAPQRNRVLGPSHPDTLTTRMGLGLTFAAVGDTTMALDVLTAAFQDCGRAGRESPHAEALRSCLADLHRADTAARPGTGVVTVPQQRNGPGPAGRDPSAPRRGRARRPTVDVHRGAGRGDVP